MKYQRPNWNLPFAYMALMPEKDPDGGSPAKNKTGGKDPNKPRGNKKGPNQKNEKMLKKHRFPSGTNMRTQINPNTAKGKMNKNLIPKIPHHKTGNLCKACLRWFGLRQCKAGDNYNFSHAAYDGLNSEYYQVIDINLDKIRSSVYCIGGTIVSSPHPV